jgi:hypothetical protein
MELKGPGDLAGTRFLVTGENRKEGWRARSGFHIEVSFLGYRKDRLRYPKVSSHHPSDGTLTTMTPLWHPMILNYLTPNPNSF